VLIGGQDIASVEFRNDSDWIEVTDRIPAGTQTIARFVLENGQFGGWSGRFQVAAGSFQYDSGKVDASNECPCKGKVFHIDVVITRNASGAITDLRGSKPVF